MKFKNLLIASDFDGTLKEYKGVKDAVLWKADSDYIQWKIKVPVSGIYNISMEYIASGNGIASIRQTPYTLNMHLHHFHNIFF